MNSHKMIFFYNLDGFLLGNLSDFLEIIAAKFVDHLSDVRLQSILLHEEFLNLQPFKVFDDYHSR